MQGLLLENRFQVNSKIGAGAFGEIWHCFDLLRKRPAAIKFENVDMKKQQLYQECNIYILLQKDSPSVALPRVHFYSSSHGKNFMVMDMLGSSLEDLMKKCGGKFSLKTTLQVAVQLIDLAEFIHGKRIIHRDIKPDNILIHCSKEDKRVFLVDFGLAKKFMNSKQEHIIYREGKGLTGTARFVSINTHVGLEQSRRDDLETIAYVLIYFLKGRLPWQGLKVPHGQEKYKQIQRMKQTISMETLCEGIPKEFSVFLEKTKQLKFEETPQYKQY